MTTNKEEKDFKGHKLGDLTFEKIGERLDRLEFTVEALARKIDNCVEQLKKPEEGEL